MPVISPRRYLTSTSSYIPSKIDGTTTSSIGDSGITNGSLVLERLTNKYSSGSSYRSSSLTNSLYGNSSNSSGYNSSTYINTRTPTYRSGLYSSSSSLSGGTSSSATTNYRPKSLYGNNDTTSTTSRFGVSNNKNSNNHRHYRSSSDSRDTASPLLSSSTLSSPSNLSCSTTRPIKTPTLTSRQSRISSLLQKNQTKLNNNDYPTTTQTTSPLIITDNVNRRNSLHKKPPIIGGSSSSSNSNNNGIITNSSIFTPTISYATLKKRIQNDEQNEIKLILKKSSSDNILSSKNNEQNCNNDNNDNSTNINQNCINDNNDQDITSKTTSQPATTNNYNKNNKKSSSSLELQIATSGLDLYEKYSPSHYIPKCELSRSRSLSEAQPTTVTIPAKSIINGNDKNLTSITTSKTNNNNNKRNSYIDTTATIHLTPGKASNKSSDNILNNNDNCNEITKTITIRKRSDSTVTFNDVEDDDNSFNNSQNNSNNKNTNTNDTSLLSTSPLSKSELSTSQLVSKSKQQQHQNQKLLLLNKRLSGSSDIINDSSITSLIVNGKPPSAAFLIYSTKNSATNTNIQNFGSQNLHSSYRDKNFLKTECELARSQVVKSTIAKFQKPSQQLQFDHSENNNNYCDNNNIIETVKLEKKYHRLSSGGNNLLKTSSTIKPLVHKTSSRIANTTKQLLQQQQLNNSKRKSITQNNNMNCLQNSQELLDDIKFIDSDDSERQQQTTISRNSSANESNYFNHRHTKLLITATSTSNDIIGLKSSTLPIYAKQRNLFNNSNTYLHNNKSNETLSNTKKDIKSQPSTSTLSTTKATASTTTESLPNVRNFNNFNSNSCDISYNSAISSGELLYYSKSIIRPILTSLKKSTVIVSSSPTVQSSQSQLHNHQNQQLLVSNNSTTLTTPQSTIVNTIISRESTSTNSPQLNHRNTTNDCTIPIVNGINSHQSLKTLLFNNNSNSCNSTNISVSCSSGNSSSSNCVYSKNITISVTTPSTINTTDEISKSIPLVNGDITVTPTVTIAAPSAVVETTTTRLSNNDKKFINNKCDIDDNVRSTSIRSALPSSPTPSRYYDRDRISSRITANDDDYKNNSCSDSKEKTGKEGLCGLRNIGNTCFMNSVIQCLSHTRELTKFLKTQTNTRPSPNTDQTILNEFVKLIREMWTPNVHSVTPLELKSAFSTKHRMYSGYNQQDAQEFLRFFLDSLHSALNSGCKGDVLKIDESLSDNKIADLTWEWYSKIENSLIRDLFVGQLKSTLKCTSCGNTSVTFDPFWDLSVPLPSSSRCKLDSCLDLFIREEVLDGDEMPTCSKCKTRRKCTKSFTIQRFPKYLVIHLKRFSETRWSKLSNIVEFPTGERELNMAPYAANRNSNCFYSLYGISNHMGSTAGGHYVALCKHPTTKKWHEFNDNVVSDDLSESILVSSSAYLLFYERA